MKEEYKDMEVMKTSLFNLRIQIVKGRKSPKWDEKHLLKVLKTLKNGKCSDPLGMTYELFKPGIIGKSFFCSLLSFCNQAKDELIIIDPLKLADITSIWKRR